MAEQRVIIEGTYPPGTAIPVTTTSSPSSPTFVEITDGTNVASLTPAGSGNGAELNVGVGFQTAVTTLNAVTANSTGSTVDAMSASSNWSAIAVATGSPTAGTLTIELSVDGTSFASSTATVSITAAGNYLVASTGRPARYARASLTGLAGTITLTVKMMAAA